MELTSRIEQLERENRRIKKALVAAALALGAIVLFCGAKFQDSPAENVRAKRFELVDAEGNVRLVIGDLNAGGQSALPGISLLTKDGKKLSDWTVSQKTAELQMYSLDGEVALEVGSQADTGGPGVFGSFAAHNLDQGSVVRVGRAFGQSGLYMEQETTAGAGRVVITLTHSKDQSASLVLDSYAVTGTRCARMWWDKV